MNRHKHLPIWVSVLGILSLIGSSFGFGSISVRPAVALTSAPLPAQEMKASPVSAPEATRKVFLPSISRAADKGWSMAGANPERTSWTAEEVRGNLRPEWYRVIDAYIPPKVQIIAINDTLFVATANGLYAFDSNTGAQRWVYATDMPLGNSPTIYNGVAYVGGFDHKLHAINATNGQKLWTFDGADAGYDTNPVVVGNLVYLGNRNGAFYAVYSNESPNRGQLAWKYQTGGPIHFSAAYKNNKIYFASEDASAYAVDASTGALLWKSAKLPVAGFHSWWPVIYTDPTTRKDVAIFVGSEKYRLIPPGPTSDLQNLDADDYLYHTPLHGNEIGARDAQGRLDASATANYFENFSWRRTYFVLDASTGQEQTYDLDRDGKVDYAPITWWGTRSGQRFPPISGGDGLIYQGNVYWVNEAMYATRGHVTGWAMGTPYMTTPNAGGTQASDEPLAYSAGGNVIYWNLCCDRTSGAFDVKSGEAWSYFSYNLSDLVRGYEVKTTGTFESNAVKVFGDGRGSSGLANKAAGWNGVYGYHGDQNPPIPYKGRVYMHRGNAIIAWSAAGGARQLAEVPVTAKPLQPAAVTVNDLKQKLETEVQKIVDAGHLRPGFGIHGAFTLVAQWPSVGDDLGDYFHNTSDTLYTLSAAYPHLSTSLQARVKTYLQSEYANYSPCQYTSIGWAGAGREWNTLPPEVEAVVGDFRPSGGPADYAGWSWPPYTFYALWQYAQIAGNAQTLFSSCRSLLETPPGNSTFLQYPEAHNAWIAGYVGYIELAKLAGNTAEANSKQTTLNQLLAARAANFPQTMNNPWGPDSHDYAQTLSVARNFMYLTPELGQYFRNHANSTVSNALDSYTSVAPYWFVTRYEASYAETVVQPLYDYWALFAAKAMISSASRDELAGYLDVSAFARGDLFYIQNLVLTIEADGAASSQNAGADLPADRAAVTQSATPTPSGSVSKPAVPMATPTVFLPMVSQSQGPEISSVTVLSASVGQYQKFEAAFRVQTKATDVFLPYEPDPLGGETGISVDMTAISPAGQTKAVPCFYNQPVDSNLVPVGAPDWRCRLAPETTGTWQFYIRATDVSGTSRTSMQSFTVTPSASRGFVRVSPTDTRYFEYSDGTPFLAPLVNVEYGSHLNDLDRIRSTIPTWGQNGVRFVRWFPTGESANFFVIPHGDDVKSSWGFGPTGVTVESDPMLGNQYNFSPYYYSGQNIPAYPGSRYRLTVRAKVTGDKVFRPQVGNIVIEVRASSWQTYTLEVVANANNLPIYLHDGFSENDNTSGTISVSRAILQRDETGQGGWGSNLITRDNQDTFRYVDQIGAARLDEILRLSEQYGVYHKLTLFHKNDLILGSLDASGHDTDWSLDNFYAPAGSAVNRYERAYARYFVARWSYSTAVHSVELANENMLESNSYDTAFDILGYMNSLSPRKVLLSNSFWGYFVNDFWSDPRASILGYADKHWYARVNGNNPELSSPIAYDSAANVRECKLAFEGYRSQFQQNVPIVRGETGVWEAGDNNFTPITLGAGATTYHHKQLWAQMGDQCGGEWYTAYLRDHDLWGMYRIYEDFFAGEPIGNGHYTDIGSDGHGVGVSNTAGSTRAWGKLNASAGRGVLWIDNANDTWKKVADGASIPATTAALTVNNVSNGTYDLVWLDTYVGTTTSTVQSVTGGKLVISVSNLQHDVAVKFSKR